MDASAIKAAAAATSATYRSFADATRSVLDLLERAMPDAVLYLASRRASMVNGSFLMVDGGASAVDLPTIAFAH